MVDCEPTGYGCDIVFAYFYCCNSVIVSKRSESWVQRVLLFDLSVGAAQVLIPEVNFYVTELF